MIIKNHPIFITLYSGYRNCAFDLQSAIAQMCELRPEMARLNSQICVLTRSQLTHFSVQNLKHLFKDLILNIKTFRNSEVNEFLDLDKTRLRLKKCATKGRSLSLAQKEAPVQDSQRLGFVPKNASIQNTTSFTSIMLSAVLQNKVENLTSQKANNLSSIRISLKSVQKT